MIDGILLINKEAGITSFDIIRRLKRIFPKGQKIGHAGTLDPFATGLLIILLGKYTKKMSEILKMQKEYIAKSEFGYSTDTQDITGKKEQEAEKLEEISPEQIQRIIEKYFLGNIMQMPPQFSAKKVGGKKAYEYAREGKQVKLIEREVTIEKFKLQNMDWPYVQFSIVCSSGTYIRTLIHDLGKKLGVYATCVELERARIGQFTLQGAIDSREIEKKGVEYFKSKLKMVV